jgi:hypothetical protein
VSSILFLARSSSSAFFLAVFAFLADLVAFDAAIVARGEVDGDAEAFLREAFLRAEV